MGSKEGRDKILARDPDFFKKIGSLGGKKSKKKKRNIIHIYEWRCTKCNLEMLASDQPLCPKCGKDMLEV